MKVIGNLDFAGIGEIQNAKFQQLASAPTVQQALFYFDTAMSPKRLRYYDGTAWVDVLAGTTYTDEQAQDTIAALIAAGARSGITITYTDAANTLDFTVTDSPLLGGQNSAFHLNRANHSGSQLAASVSDFDTQVRTSRLDQMTAPTSDLSINSHKLTNVTDGTSPQDAVTFSQLGLAQQGVFYKAGVKGATAAAGTLASAFENGDTIDTNVTLVTGDRILIKDQASGGENGIYTVNASGAPTRATDADAFGELQSGATVFVDTGTANANTQWTQTATLASLATAQTWAKTFQVADLVAGAGLTKTGSTLDVGAGSGITVAADSVAVDNATVSRRVSALSGAGATSYTFTHGLGVTRGTAQIQVVEIATYQIVYPTIVHADTNSVTISGWASNPATDAYLFVAS